jgi:hypothetical protein
MRAAVMYSVVPKFTDVALVPVKVGRPQKMKRKTATIPVCVLMDEKCCTAL